MDFINGKTANNVNITLQTDGKIRYTVPQMIKRVEDTKVYFRVADVFRDARIVVKCADRVLTSKKKQKLAPGEMETVTLTEAMLSELGEDARLEFSLEI